MAEAPVIRILTLHDICYLFSFHFQSVLNFVDFHHIFDSIDAVNIYPEC